MIVQFAKMLVYRIFLQHKLLNLKDKQYKAIARNLYYAQRQKPRAISPFNYNVNGFKVIEGFHAQNQTRVLLRGFCNKENRMITQNELKAIMGSVIAQSTVERLTYEFNYFFPLYEINSPQRMAAFITKYLSENPNVDSSVSDAGSINKLSQIIKSVCEKWKENNLNHYADDGNLSMIFPNEHDQRKYKLTHELLTTQKTMNAESNASSTQKVSSPNLAMYSAARSSTSPWSLLVTPDETLKNKTVIVTAGNRGGGASIAMRYAASSANVAIIVDKTTSTASSLNVSEVSNKIVAAGGKSMTLEVDLADAQEIKLSVEKIISKFNSIDILINNFSTFNFKNSSQTTSEDFSKIIKNVYTTFFFSQACIPFLQKSQNPHVINIAPPLDMKAADEACENHLLFSISKYGMSLCTKGMAAEFKKYDIAFNSLWQERPIATQTLTDNFDNQVVRGSNRPEIYAEAAYLISLKLAKEFTGNYCIDADILYEAGIDVKKYAVDPSAPPVKDIFLPGADYNVLRAVMK